MGTPDFAVPCLEALISQGRNIVAVVTQPDRPKGRGKKLAASPVKMLAVENNLEVLQPEKASDSNFCDQIESREPDLMVVVAFGQILKKRLLDIPKWGAVNVHASLLPMYRGAAPIQRAILNEDDKTGLTLMRMEEGLDTGPILLQEECPILKDETAGQLHDRLALMAADLMMKWLNQMAESPIEERPQDHSAASYAPKIEKGMSLIDWKQSASKVSALIRALDPKPGAYTTWQDKRIKLFASGVTDKESRDVIPGKVVGQGEDGLIVETGQGRIQVLEMQYPGKKRLPAKDCLRGASFPDGTILGG
jgi:methionyl-tRNA formyltransferase